MAARQHLTRGHFFVAASSFDEEAVAIDGERQT
jgi:hypothetical protein